MRIHSENQIVLKRVCVEAHGKLANSINKQITLASKLLGEDNFPQDEITSKCLNDCINTGWREEKKLYESWKEICVIDNNNVKNGNKR